MKIGIRAHDLGMKNSARELAVSIREAGFESAQLVLAKAIKGALHQAGSLSFDYARKMRQVFQEEGVEIALLGAYFNWFHDGNNTGAEKYKEHLQYASDFGTSIVGTEVQGVTSDRWAVNPENDSEASWTRVVSLAGELCATAEKFGVKAGIEGAVAHVLSTPRKVCNLAETLKSDHLALIFDLYNFLSMENYKNQRSIIDEALELYGNKLEIIHCKDFIPRTAELEQVALGDGLFDYEYLIKRLYQTGHEKVTLIFEGVTGEGIPTSLEFIKKTIAACC